jgi:uncharacterized membrane protein
MTGWLKASELNFTSLVIASVLFGGSFVWVIYRVVKGWLRLTARASI